MQKSSEKQKKSIADEAARIIVEEGMEDYNHAGRKACARLGYYQKRDLPRNADIEQAVLERHRLFSSPGRSEILAQLRQTALAVMRFLNEFEPHLVGSVLKGTANRYSDIQLHLFSDDTEAVAIRLINAGIRYHAIERRKHRERPDGIPGFSFSWQGFPVEALVFESSGLRIAPPSPIDGKPVRRAAESEVHALLMINSPVADDTAG